MKRSLVLVPVFLFLTGNTLFGFIKSVHMFKKKQQYCLEVVLSSPGKIKIYYDSQKPVDPDNLFKFWFHENSKVFGITNVFVLDEFKPGMEYFCRFELLTGKKGVSVVYRMIYPRGAENRVEVLPEGSVIRSGTL